MAFYNIFCHASDVDEIFKAISTSASLTVYLRQRKQNETYLPEKYIVVTTEYYTDQGVISELKNVPIFRQKMKEGVVLVLRELSKNICIGV